MQYVVTAIDGSKSSCSPTIDSMLYNSENLSLRLALKMWGPSTDRLRMSHIKIRHRRKKKADARKSFDLGDKQVKVKWSHIASNVFPGPHIIL